MPKVKKVKVEKAPRSPKYLVTLVTNGQIYRDEGPTVLKGLEKIKIKPMDVQDKTYVKVELNGREKVIFVKPLQLRQLYSKTNNAMMSVLAKRLSLLV